MNECCASFNRIASNPVVVLTTALVLLMCGSATGVETLIYSFEADADGFAPNGFPGTPEITQDTIGATEGIQSLKVFVPSPGSFVGALSTLVTDILNPPGIDHVLFDLTITEPFGPPPPDPAGFAVIGITMFGHAGGQFGLQAQFADTEPIDGKVPGTYRDIRIDLDESVGPYRAGETFNDIFCTGEECAVDDLSPSGFQFFLNKTPSTSAHPLTVYIDNVRIVPPTEGVLGDYNDNGTVDAADYVLWRNDGPLANEVADPGNVSPADFTEWRARFGNTGAAGGGSAASVPEPVAVVLMIAVGLFLSMTRRGNTVR
jgi:hypothetical protein